MPTKRTTKMANGSSLGVNVDALNAVVQGHGREIGEIRDQIQGLGNRMASDIQAISNKIDGQQQANWAQQQAAAAGNRTNWLGVVGAVGTATGVLVSVFVVIGSMALSPIREAEARQELTIEKLAEAETKKVSNDTYIAGLAAQQVRNLALESATTKVNDALNTALIAQAYLNGQNAAQLAEIMRTNDREEKRTDMIDSQLVKRPELAQESSHVQQEFVEQRGETEQRLNAISARQTTFETWLQSLAPGLKEIISTIELRLDRLTFAFPQNAQPTPAVPAPPAERQ